MPTKAGRLLHDMAESKATRTLQKLINGAENVLDRGHYKDRVLKKIKRTHMIGVKSVRISAESTSSGEAKHDSGNIIHKYPVEITFYNVSYSKTRDAKHVIEVPKDNKMWYMEQINAKKHPVRVYCLCPWYRHACFTGDTLIPTLDGTSKPIKDLVGQEFYVYAYDLEMKETVVTKAINCRLTQKQAPIVEVTFDNGNTIRCTPDHRFLLANGEYKEIIDITKDEVLSTLHRIRDYKVVSVKTVGTADVYCLEVPGYNNFAIDVDNNVDCSSGVFVHNCEHPVARVGAQAATHSKLRSYTRKDGKKPKKGLEPSPNIDKIPAICKHIYQLALTMNKKKFNGVKFIDNLVLMPEPPPPPKPHERPKEPAKTATTALKQLKRLQKKSGSKKSTRKKQESRTGIKLPRMTKPKTGIKKR